MTTKQETKLLILACGVGLGLRLWLAAGHYGNYDEVSFEHVSGIVARGGNVYAETTRYNYGPAWFLILGAIGFIQRATHLEFHTLVRGFLSLIDVGDAVLIAMIARSVRCAAVYMLTPVAILVTGLHGQFDNLASLPLLGAAWLLVRGESPDLRAVWALATAALCIKHLNVFLVWMLLWYAFPWRKAAVAFAGSLAVFAAQFVPWLGHGGAAGIWQNVILYRGQAPLPDNPIAPTPYGLTRWLSSETVSVIFVLVMAALPAIAKVLRLSLPQALALSAVALLVFMPGRGEAYLILPALFGALVLGPGYWIFTAVAYLFLQVGPNYLQVVSAEPPWGLLWATEAGWLLAMVAGALLRLRPRRGDHGRQSGEPAPAFRGGMPPPSS